MIFAKSKKARSAALLEKAAVKGKRIQPKDARKGGVPKDFGDSKVPSPREGHVSKKVKK